MGEKQTLVIFLWESQKNGDYYKGSALDGRIIVK
jgi:hypothetical protein